MDEPDIQNLIEKIAETGADPAWFAELISEAQVAGAGRSAVIAAGLDPGPDQRDRPRQCARARNSD